MRTFWLVLLVGCGTPQVSMDAVSEAAAEASITDAFPEAAPEAAVCPDEDNDGHRARACGGDDCNDSDPAIAPGLPPRCVRDGTLPFPYRSQIVRCMACSETPRMPGMYGCACWSDRTGEQQCSP